MGAVVITGASGFIGRSVARRAAADGHRVIALTRSDGTAARGYEDVGALQRAFEGADAVIHLAARAHRGGTDADFECNVRSASAVAMAARHAGVPRAVLASSIGVNGNVTRGEPFTEDDAPAPVEPYARSKQRAEAAWVAAFSGSVTRWAILRPPLVVGADAPGNFARLVHAVRRGIPLPIAAVRNQRSLVGVDNLARAMLTCAFHSAAADQLFVVADEGDVSTPEIVACIAKGLQRKARMVSVPPVLVRAAAGLAGRHRLAESLCASLQVDAGKLRRLTGWTPGDTRLAIEQAAAAWSVR
jgi:UDP-4-keto-D-FucNAc 4-reductase